ncbi:MAG: 4Fe-4S dicluster domain-containing protein [Planctomycetota bacterium]
MTVRADPELLPEIRKFGAFDVNACFNCGNCTAVCPLSKDDDAFPRRMIRYAQVGLPDHLVASKEIWLCHYCGDCSETCPRQAEPGEFMAAARRYAISRMDPTGVSRFLHLAPWKANVALLAVIALLTGLFLALSPGLPEGRFSTASMLRFVPYEVVHWAGIAVMGIMGAVTVVTVANLVWALTHGPAISAVDRRPAEPGLFPGRSVWQAVTTAVGEVLGHRSFRECGVKDAEPDERALYLRPWFVHMSIMLGFFGLLAATGLDYAFKDPDVHVPIWSPIRLLGTIAGLFFVYGTTTSIVRRVRGKERAAAHSRHADWLLLLLLWATGVSGFAIELAIYLDVAGSPFLYGLFLLHLVVALLLLLLLPFSKFAHAVYRPLALFIHALRVARRPAMA